MIIKSLSCTPVVITKSLDVLDNVAIVVPPSLNSISPPSASNVISAPQSNVIADAATIFAPTVKFPPTLAVPVMVALSAIVVSDVV